MKAAFHISEAFKDKEHIWARGRAEKLVSVGDKFLFEQEDGEFVHATVLRIETYGRSTRSLGPMWTGNLLLAVSGSCTEQRGRLLQEDGS